MPRIGKKLKKEKENLLQIQTNKLLKKRKRKHSPTPSSSSCESFKGFGKENVKSEVAAKIRRQMALLQQQLEQVDNEDQQHDDEDENDQEEAAPERNVEEIQINKQLFGKNYTNEEMVHLKDDIYCRKKIYEMATGCSFKPSHVARRLLDGVFKTEAILTSTLTGQSPKSQGRERQMQKYDRLDIKAKTAIVEFSLDYGKKRGWVQQSTYDINRALSQKIGEFKRLQQRNDT